MFSRRRQNLRDAFLVLAISLLEGPFARTDESSQEIDVVYIIAADDRRSYELCHSNLLPSDSKRTPISRVTMTSAHYVID